ncbi:hypothetical protein [Pseudoduganella lutea]|uniref:Uncharacterized protein n=1 Tax=Pseudoduganella lutea TaxID=321985 RepID=A0A4P6KU76_9BURK|nr:hypothetical protein [Pseudoduganella lutea]QBE62366.1 hypothetical protein EWM63_04685 [Pseudoduganella lutea]
MQQETPFEAVKYSISTATTTSIMISSLQQIIDFDGSLVTATGQHTPATCKVVLPDATWQPVNISISLSQSGRIVDLETPFSLSGKDRYGRKISITDIHYHEINFELNRHTGLAEMNIQLIGEIEVIHGVRVTQGERKVNFSISDAIYLRMAKAASVDFKPETQVEDLFSLTLPEVGSANFLRQWRFWRNADNVTSKGGCSFILELADASKVPDLAAAAAAAVLRRALVVPSIFIRQRIAVNGWEEQGSSTVEVIRQPLMPITPKSYAIEPNKHIVDKPRLMKVAEQACLNFSGLSESLKGTIEKISMGLVPYINLNYEERFRAMFYGLESCRKYAGKKPSDEVIQAKNEVLAALKEAKKILTGLLQSASKVL